MFTIMLVVWTLFFLTVGSMVFFNRHDEDAAAGIMFLAWIAGIALFLVTCLSTVIYVLGHFIGKYW